MGSWTIGDVRITSLLEIQRDLPAEELIPALSPEGIAPHLSSLQPDYVTSDLLMKVAIQALLVESGGKRILIDTCFGNDRKFPYAGMAVLHTDFLERLTGHGFGPDDVDVVVCTHLHFDHVGWNTRLIDGSWQPTFPRAEYLIGRTEFEHWQDHDDFNIDLTDSIDPIVAAGLHRFVDPDFQITPELQLEPSPGHTPGHVCVRIRSNGESALIGGDLIHHPVQIFEQGWSSGADYDPECAVATRRRVLEGLANTDTVLIGTHFATPSAGRVRHDGGGWAWDPVRDSGV